MLTKCEACKQVVEISYLNLHLLSEYSFLSNYIYLINGRIRL